MQKKVNALVILFLSLSSCRGFAAEFQPLQLTDVEASTVSGDGNVVFGFGGQGFPAKTHRWTETEGWKDLGPPPGPGFFRPLHATRDGSLVVSGLFPESAVWSLENGYAAMPGDIGFVPVAVTPDGAVFVGHGADGADAPRRAYRFREPEGYTLLLDDDDKGSFASSVSANGAVIVGSRNVDDDQTVEILRWTQAEGIMDLATVRSTSILPAIVSPDGSVIVWSDNVDDGISQVYRWTSDSSVTPVTGFTGQALAVSGDGSFVLGHTIDTSFRFEAVIWDASVGTRSINDLLVGVGLEIPDWRFTEAFGISHDGYVLVGNGVNPEGGYEPWRIVLDRGDFDINGAFDVNDIETLAAARREETQYTRYDVNGDAMIDHEDRRVLVEELANTYFGDANLDGEFNSQDLVDVFQAAEYEDGVLANSTWSTGDWDGDSEFSSSDLVLAFQGGGYEQGPRASANAVPEPSTVIFVALAAISIGSFRSVRTDPAS